MQREKKPPINNTNLLFYSQQIKQPNLDLKSNYKVKKKQRSRSYDLNSLDTYIARLFGLIQRNNRTVTLQFPTHKIQERKPSVILAWPTQITGIYRRNQGFFIVVDVIFLFLFRFTFTSFGWKLKKAMRSNSSSSSIICLILLILVCSLMFEIGG